jgi:sulfate/thiosulfate transport system substrate-binding protein
MRAMHKWLSGLSLALLVTLSIVACSSVDRTPLAERKTVELTLVGYAIPKIAHNAIIQKFAAEWKRSHNGQEVVFNQSYGASGSQTRAVLDGLDADIVHLAIEADINKLVMSGLIRDDWKDVTPNRGIVAQSVAVILTRSGNPKQIKTFADLSRPDVKWVTPNPKTSGVARWNYYALWNQAKQSGQTDQQAQSTLTAAFKNVVVLARDAREATDAFAHQAQGDALLNYENEAILAQKKGESLAFIVPDVNMAIDTPIAIVDKNVDKHGTRAVAEAFVNYMFTPEAQRELGRIGYRPLGDVGKEAEFVQQFRPIAKLARIKDYGGWKIAQKSFEEGGSFDKIEIAMTQQK